MNERNEQPPVGGVGDPGRLRQFVTGIRTDIRATVEQTDALYEGDQRRQAILGAASLVAQVAELGLDQLDAALAAQAETLAALEWQDIATAPKGADVVLLYLDGSGVQPGYWDDDMWLACETQGLTGGRWHAEPTHWMPLPSPPRLRASRPAPQETE